MRYPFINSEKRVICQDRHPPLQLERGLYQVILFERCGVGVEQGAVEATQPARLSRDVQADQKIGKG
jgi:hypothetical protein